MGIVTSENPKFLRALISLDSLGAIAGRASWNFPLIISHSLNITYLLTYVESTKQLMDSIPPLNDSRVSHCYADSNGAKYRMK